MKNWYKEIFGSLKNVIAVMMLVLILIPTLAFGTISYYQYRKIAVDNAVKLNQNNTLQIASNIDGLMKKLGNISLSFLQNVSVREFLLADGKEEVEDALYLLNRHISNQLCYEEYIYAVDFQRIDGISYSSSSITDGISDDLRETLIKEDGKAVFLTEIGVAEEDGNVSEPLYGYARCVKDINNIGHIIGFEKLYIKKSSIMRLISDELNEDEDYYVVDGQSIRISSDSDAEGKIFSEYISDLDYPPNKLREHIVYSKIPSMNWYMIKKISPLQMEDDIAVVKQLLISTGILGISIYAFIGFFIAGSVIQPLKELESTMRHLEENDFKRKLPETGYREIVVLARTFNKMTDRMDELVNRVYRAEIREKDAQIRAMQAYINPHFLYNTLDTICWMSRMEQAFETCSLIEALSKLFRSSVKDTSKTTTVNSEMKHIESYIKIQECRHTDTIEFLMDVEPGTEECETIRFLLQPLVENAIVHGMEEQDNTGIIRISSRKEEKNLVLSVEDEGQGADIEGLEHMLEGKIEGTRGAALFNVHERIRLCFGEEYGLRFKKGNKRGLIVEAVQPFKKGK